MTSLRSRTERTHRSWARLGAVGVTSLLSWFSACKTDLPEEVFSGSDPSTSGRPGIDAHGASGGASTGPAEDPSQGGDSGEGPGRPPSEAGAGGDPDTALGRNCGTAPVQQGAFTRKLLRRAAVDCAIWHFCEFENAAGTLQSRVAKHVQAPREETLLRAQDAWKAAISVWSRIEMFQFGPLSSRTENAGKDVHQGQGVRELVYAWPSLARCRVEEQIVGQGFAARGMDAVPISGRGLYALEYLLFYPGADSACAVSSATAKAWPTPAGLSERKLAFASAVAEDVLHRIQALSALYAPDGGDFAENFVDARGYPSEQEALSVLGWALIYVEREVKDWKLGVPAGYVLTHPVAEHEAPFSLYGTENIRNNLRGFRSLFQGCGPDGEGIGFDDWLTEAGHAELAQDIVHAWKAAQTAADAFPAYEKATRGDFQSLYASVKALTDLLKSELFGSGSPLNLELPKGVASDTD